MKNINLRYLALIAVLAATCIAVNLLAYNDADLSGEELEATKGIPLKIGHWIGKDLLLEEKIYEILETRAIIHRQFYSEQAQEVFLSIVYYASAKVDFHAPEQCFGSQGIALETSSKKIPILVQENILELNVNQMVSSGTAADSLVYYFYKTGETMGSSYIRLRLHLALNRLTTSAPNGTLIRISTPVYEENITEAEDTLQEFIQLLYPLLVEHL